MDRLDAMSLFIAAVDDGSLAAAARRHGRSAAAATRAVALLEKFTGETLLLRSTRRLSLTSAGERHIAIWRDVLVKLGTAGPGSDGPMSGAIVLTAPELLGRMKVTPIVESFMEMHQQVRARVLMLNRLVDLVGEGVDIAVRLAALPDSTMKAIKLGEVRRLVCASPDYLSKRGMPQTPNCLEEHDCIGLDGQSDRELWPFGGPNTERVRSVRVGTRLSMNSVGAAIDAAVRGHGVIRPLSYQVSDELSAGSLVRVLSDFEPTPTPVNLVFTADAAKRPAMRAFIDHAVPLLKAELKRIAIS